MKKILIGGLMIALVGGAFLAVKWQASQELSGPGAAEKKDEDEKKEMIYTVDTVHVRGKVLSTYVTSTATLQADRQVDIFSKVAGQVKVLVVEEGQRVRQGDILLKLDGDDAKLRLDQAKVNLNKAKTDLERFSKSFEKALVSAEDYDVKKYEAERNSADYELAAYQLKMTQLEAPFDGTIVTREVELGQTIQPSEMLFTLVSLDPLKAEVFFPENRVQQIRENMKVSFSKKDDFKDVFFGEVVRISPIVDHETGTVKVTIAIKDAPDSVRPGTYTHLRIVTRTQSVDRVVPEKALVYDSRQNAYLFLVHEGGDNLSVSKVPVKIGIKDDGFVEILEGINVDDRIVLTGKESLKDGSQVKFSDETQKQQS